MHVADLDCDGRDDLLIAGTDRFGVLQTGRQGQRLKSIATYESKRTDARLADLAAGDVNGDGAPDVVFTDIGEQSIEIASYAGDPELLTGITFKLFERKIVPQRQPRRSSPVTWRSATWTATAARTSS